MLYCKFAANLQNTFLEEHLWETASVLYLYIGTSNKLHILLTSFYNLQTKICKSEQSPFEGFLHFMIYLSYDVSKAPILFSFNL